MSVKTTTTLPTFFLEANEQLVADIKGAMAKQFHIKISDIEARSFTLQLLLSAANWENKIQEGYYVHQPAPSRQ